LESIHSKLLSQTQTSGIDLQLKEGVKRNFGGWWIVERYQFSSLTCTAGGWADGA